MNIQWDETEMVRNIQHLIGYSTHMASNLIIWGINIFFTEKLCSLFSQRFSTI